MKVHKTFYLKLNNQDSYDAGFITGEGDIWLYIHPSWTYAERQEFGRGVTDGIKNDYNRKRILESADINL